LKRLSLEQVGSLGQALFDDSLMPSLLEAADEGNAQQILGSHFEQSFHSAFEVYSPVGVLS